MPFGHGILDLAGDERGAELMKRHDKMGGPDHVFVIVQTMRRATEIAVVGQLYLHL
jgi:hypothetical protein